MKGGHPVTPQAAHCVVAEAIEKAGGVTKLAARFPYPISYVAILKWKKSRVPAERVLDFEAVTGIPKERIRPDLYLEESAA